MCTKLGLCWAIIRPMLGQRDIRKINVYIYIYVNIYVYKYIYIYTNKYIIIYSIYSSFGHEHLVEIDPFVEN